MDRILAFDLWGEYAHFRKYYTTTSPLTYSFPPRTALCGLMGAILGLSKETYLSHFLKDRATLGVALLSPVKKVHFSENLIDTDPGRPMNLIKNHTRIRIEFLKDPRYRVYFSHADPELYERARDLIDRHQCVYTPCLGLSEHIANFSFVGEYRAARVDDPGKIEIRTVVPDNHIREIAFASGAEYMTETMPNEMLPDRTVTEYRAMLFERRGRPIRASLSECWRLDDGSAISIL
ncbi:MAG: type I-B CRISPR-associated protein Cas5b [Methanospirillum sp.]